MPGIWNNFCLRIDMMEMTGDFSLNNKLLENFNISDGDKTKIKDENIVLMNNYGMDVDCPFYGFVSQFNVWDEIINLEDTDKINGNIVSWEDAMLITNFDIIDVPDYLFSYEPFYKIGR